MDLLTVDRWVTPTDRADLAVLTDPTTTPLAGGTWLFADQQTHLRTLVDLTALGWEPVVRRPDGSLELAATCTVAQLLEVTSSRALTELAPECAQAFASSPKVWDHATLGGNVCCALPAGPMTTLLVALEAVATVWRPDGTAYDVPVLDLVIGVARTSLAPGDVVRCFTVPADALSSTTSFQRVSLAPQGRTGAIVVARRPADGDHVVVTVTGGTERPHRIALGSADERDRLTAALDDLTDWLEDHHGTPPWRRAMTRRLGLLALEELAS